MDNCMIDDQPHDKARIAASFSQAAQHYDGEATLQRVIGNDLLARVDSLGALPLEGSCVDIGCGTGFLLKQLQQGFDIAPARLTGVDLATGMLAQARQQLPDAHWLCADAEHTGLATHSTALCVSNLAVQWLDRLDDFLNEMNRVLLPGGWLAFTTLGSQTLSEFKTLCRDAGFGPTTNRFIRTHALRASLAASPFHLHQCARTQHSLDYPDALALMRGLKSLGAHHRHAQRRSGCTGRGQLLRLKELSHQRFPHGIPARYDSWCVVLQKPKAQAA